MKGCTGTLSLRPCHCCISLNLDVWYGVLLGSKTMTLKHHCLGYNNFMRKCKIVFVVRGFKALVFSNACSPVYKNECRHASNCSTHAPAPPSNSTSPHKQLQPNNAMCKFVPVFYNCKHGAYTLARVKGMECLIYLGQAGYEAGFDCRLVNEPEVIPLGCQQPPFTLPWACTAAANENRYFYCDMWYWIDVDAQARICPEVYLDVLEERKTK